MFKQLQTESLSAQPNLHFYVPFSFSSPASHRLLLLLPLHVKFKEQDLRRSIGVNPSSLVLLVEEDECGPIRWPPPSHVCVCVFIYYKTALISLVQHSILCSLSISGNTDNKNKMYYHFSSPCFLLCRPSELLILRARLVSLSAV